MVVTDDTSRANRKDINTWQSNAGQTTHAYACLPRPFCSPVLRKPILLAEDPNSPQAQLVPCSHDPHSNLAPIGCHDTLERHIKTSTITGRLRRQRTANLVPEANGCQFCWVPKKHAPSEGQAQPWTNLHVLNLGNPSLLTASLSLASSDKNSLSKAFFSCMSPYPIALDNTFPCDSERFLWLPGVFYPRVGSLEDAAGYSRKMVRSDQARVMKTRRKKTRDNGIVRERRSRDFLA